MIPRRVGRESHRGIGVFPLLLAVVSLAHFLGCRGEGPPGDPGFVLDVGISPTPPGVGPARLIITLRDTLGNPIDGARMMVEGNMTHAGMVPVLDSAIAQGEGVYSVPAFRFTMAGDWILTVTAELPDGRSVRVQKGTDVASAPPGFRSGGDAGGTGSGH